MKNNSKLLRWLTPLLEAGSTCLNHSMTVLGKGLFLLISFLVLQSCSTGSDPQQSTRQAILIEWPTIKSTILAQRKVGYPNYDPKWIYVVDPATQQMNVVSLKTGETYETLRCGTGKRGLGISHAQTPPGFFTMGGVRIAKNADSSIQTGDSKRGVSGIYAEILYPPTHSDPTLRGYVPNGVVIHSYNPNASKMLYQRRAQRKIGRIPCTTGCPVLEIDEAPRLVSYLKQSAGKFDPTATPNTHLQALIRSGQVTQYHRDQLGDPIYILNRQ